MTTAPPSQERFAGNSFVFDDDHFRIVLDESGESGFWTFFSVVERAMYSRTKIISNTTVEKNPRHAKNANVGLGRRLT